MCGGVHVCMHVLVSCQGLISSVFLLDFLPHVLSLSLDLESASQLTLGTPDPAS